MDRPIGLKKPAQTSTEVHELIRERWSPRAFSSAPVPGTHLDLLFEAARWAPSSRNEQPWSFVVADRYADPESHARIVSALVPSNQVWARNAPILLMAVARLHFAKDGAANRVALYDTGQAVAQLALQATSLGLAVHQMGGFDAEQARSLLAIPDGYEPVVAIAIGYPGQPGELNPDLLARELAPRRRRPTAEWVHQGRWGQISQKHT